MRSEKGEGGGGLGVHVFASERVCVLDSDANARRPHAQRPQLPILIPCTSLFLLSLTDLASPLTPASLLKLGAAVITARSPLNTPRSRHPFELMPHGAVAHPAKAA